MMKLTKFKLALALIGLLASSCALAQAKYVWMDEHGIKQFSDTPPPANIPEKNILKQPHRTSPLSNANGASASTSDAAASAPEAKPQSLADKEADYNKRKAEQADKDKKADTEAANAKAKADNCTRAKDYLAALNSGTRMKTVDQNGQQSYMDDNQRSSETAAAQQSVNANCN